MQLLEHEAKSLLKDVGITLPQAHLIKSSSEDIDLDFPIVLKVQIPSGGRGKAGGIRIVNSYESFKQTTEELLSTPILGYTPSALLAEECLAIQSEFYLAFSVDLTHRNIVLLAHKQGGVEIESTAADSSLLSIPISSSLSENVIDDILTEFNLGDEYKAQLQKLLLGLWGCFTDNDALLLEINPLILTDNKRLVCADAKMVLDDSAQFRHKNWHFTYQNSQSQFVMLDQAGTVASMANGAGLAMATVDAINTAGGKAANFLDIGGGTNTESMVKSFESILNITSVKAIVINIYAGITRCDEVADAIILAKQRLASLPPLFIRLSGTNEEHGKSLLQKNGITTLTSLQECVDRAINEVRNV